MATRRKLTPKQAKFVRSIQKIVGKTDDIPSIITTLTQRGFVMVDYGAYKNVYLKESDNYCIKVYRDTFGWKNDSYEVPECLSKYYIHPIYSDKRFIIQRWVKEAKTFYKTKIRKIPKKILKNDSYDLHCHNVKYDGHKQVIIDFCY